MRKTNNKQKTNLEKLKINRLTLQRSFDEKEEDLKFLERAKAHSCNPILLPKGYSSEWEKEKTKIKEKKLGSEVI